MRTRKSTTQFGFHYLMVDEECVLIISMVDPRTRDRVISNARAALWRLSKKTGRKFITKQNGRGGLIVKRIV